CALVARDRVRSSGRTRQRDSLLTAGVCVETLETSTYWSMLSWLRHEVRMALSRQLGDDKGEPVVMCHISHAYETGASLYFTVLTARDDQDPFGQWQRAKAAASAAISSAVGDGEWTLGTVTHHHAVGVDHAAQLPREIGEPGIAVLAAAKRAVDPTAILNPGKLLADQGAVQQ